MDKNTCERKTVLSNDINPFIHRLELTSNYDKIKTAVLTVFVLPLRVAAICGLLVLAWCLACIGLYGISDEELSKRPLSGWRKKLRGVIALVGLLTYRIGGMNYTMKGRRAKRSEAPILVLAPHSSFLDAIVVYATGFPSIIARCESGVNPWVGKLINFTQPLYVRREDPNSRLTTVRQIIDRANSKLDWSQVLIFPEGTTTNRTCLITFKCGAFYPGVPVQPVLIRYPNRLDTVTWTWDGPGVLKLLWYTLTQIHSNCEIEFLPVYKPSPEEKNDAKLYANNVRKIMAKSLGIPTSEFTYEHCKLKYCAQKMHLELANSIIEVQQLRESLNLHRTLTDAKYLKMYQDGYPSIFISKSEFAFRLKIPEENPIFNQLFDLCDVNSSGLINWFEYLMAVLVIESWGNLPNIVDHLLMMVNPRRDSKIFADEFALLTKRTLDWDAEKSDVVFKAIDSKNLGYIKCSQVSDYANQCEILKPWMTKSSKIE